jgi:hypothetical protein
MLGVIFGTSPSQAKPASLIDHWPAATSYHRPAVLGVAFLDSRLPHGAKDPTATVDSYDAVGQIVSRVTPCV